MEKTLRQSISNPALTGPPYHFFVTWAMGINWVKLLTCIQLRKTGLISTTSGVQAITYKLDNTIFKHKCGSLNIKIFVFILQGHFQTPQNCIN